MTRLVIANKTESESKVKPRDRLAYSNASLIL